MAVNDSSYSGSFYIDQPIGVYQAAGDTNGNPRYAYKAENIRTERGMLSACPGVSRALPGIEDTSGAAPESVLPETMVYFNRRNTDDDAEVFVAAGGGGLWTYTEGAEGWQRVRGDDGNVLTFLSNRWSTVTYDGVHGDGDNSVDVLMLSNNADGLYILYGDTLTAQKVHINAGQGDTALEDVRFSSITRYAERIWGTGDPRKPDAIYYSRPYNPTDWSLDPEGITDNGGGVIMQPTWDGESFTAIVPFGSYLLALKPSTVFEIRGTDPSNLTITTAYGTDSAIVGGSVCADLTSLYYMSRDGIGVYNGQYTTLLSKDALYETMHDRHMSVINRATACVSRHVYYLAFATEGAVENNTVVEYDPSRGAFMIRKGLNVINFFTAKGEVYFVTRRYLDTDPEKPLYTICKFNDEDAPGNLGNPIRSVWETGWMDLGKQYMKDDFVLRFTAESNAANTPLKFTIITDRKAKMRVCTLQKRRKDYKLHIQNTGKRVKLRVESTAKVGGWRIIGGILVNYSFERED